jgi:hypothetical protein
MVYEHKDADFALPDISGRTALVGIREAQGTGLGPLIKLLVQSKPMCPGRHRTKISVFPNLCSYDCFCKSCFASDFQQLNLKNKYIASGDLFSK